MANKKAVIIFELKDLQVFCYVTMEEWATRHVPEQIFWKRKGEAMVYGPFASINSAVQHYTLPSPPTEPTPKNVLMVDFKSKKRL